MGGYLAGLFASQNPERVQSLFCISPAGFEAYNPDDYDPFNYPDFDNPEKSFHPTVVEGLLKAEAAQKHPQSAFMKKSPEKLGKIVEKMIVS